MSSLFVALFALVASSFRTRAALPAEILALPLFKVASISHSRRVCGSSILYSEDGNKTPSLRRLTVCQVADTARQARMEQSDSSE
jgi:hypothetical protein